MKLTTSVLLLSLSLNLAFAGDPSDDKLAAEFRVRFGQAKPVDYLQALLTDHAWQCKGKSLTSYSYELIKGSIQFSVVFDDITDFLEGNTTDNMITSRSFDISFIGIEAQSQFSSGQYMAFRILDQKLFIEVSKNSGTVKIPSVVEPNREATAYYICN